MKLSHHYAKHLPELVSPVRPSPLGGMRLALVNRELADEFSLPKQWWESDTLVRGLSNPDFELCRYAVAQKYGGHQFGQWNPYLGDGRGLLLGEITDLKGQPNDLHLKGAGPTPYSRHADGRAVLRSTLREYLGSEALHHLGIPSSRALCLFTSKQKVLREQPEPGAMMIRTAQSHIRFGHFEYFFHAQEKRKLNALFEFTLNRYFRQCLKTSNPHASLLRSICLRTARMIALWQAHGFVHGVMNTDNMSIHGITFDYGPYAFMEHFEPQAVFNHSDHQGRYAFDQQPGVALWNLNALAWAFTDQCSKEEIVDILNQFEPTFIQQYQLKMLQRLGLPEASELALRLLNQWLDMIAGQQRDYHHTFRLLALTDPQQSKPALRDTFVDRDAFDNWWREYRALRTTVPTTQAEMLAVNPAVIARTQFMQDAIVAAEQGDFSVAEQLLEALRRPFSTKYDSHPLCQPPSNTQTISLSCSS
ncbi:YdiU family protein [Alteromonas aestuariivivens]|uniref:Protein nucleotidyltransferase YdiU n=1 Tax=Alteromonas aestuariivivens TaxID=1938339 RepID=A0A3D8M7B2_9ALTE|nr:YdiU family protein [Alteromonas aestuariivivens]RDV25513.1 YdiU family protein [Alteromonas aestuariivivens]